MCFGGISGAVKKLFTTDTTIREFYTFCHFISAERTFSEWLFHIGKLTLVSAGLSKVLGDSS